jgi:ATP-binding cassette, subfamily B, bacterial
MSYRNPILALLKHTSPNKGKIIFACLCSTLNKICDIVPEILIGLSIDVIVNQKNSVIATLGIVDPYTQLCVVGGLTALLWILESLFEYLYSIAWHSLAQEIQHHLRLKTYAGLQEQDMAYFEKTTTGQLLNTLYADINLMERFFSEGLNQVIQLAVNIIVMGAIFFYLSTTLAILTLLPIPFVVGIAYYFQHTLANLYTHVRETASDLSSHIAYRLQGIATIKSYTTQDYELALLQKEDSVYMQANHRALQVSALYIPTVRMAIMVGFIMSLVIGGFSALNGTMPINWYATLVFLTQRFLWPFTSLTQITDMYEMAASCAKRILAVLNSHPNIHSGNDMLNLSSMAGTISFNNVSFAYHSGEANIFDAINFELPAKKTAAFVGSTGSGKSTIIKLLLRFYDPTQGTILIGGTNIKNLTLTDLRACIGLVSQDVYVVEGSIADNISYGTFDASREEIIKAAQMAHAHDFIMALPKEYDTKVEEHGKNLSGGQRQRIAIARAIIKKSPILIFDEATSAIDNETEAAIQQSMSSLTHNHTIIIIAHRLSTVQHADTIFVLNQGTIIETGDHASLLEKNGAYAKLWHAH